MSCSQFIEHDEEDKSDTLVVIVNGDGTVSVDRETLERVLQQQCRAAVSFIKLEDSHEPDSQSGKVNAEENDASPEDKEALCHKVNLVVEGYYPPPPLGMAGKNNNCADSVVSSTVTTPPLAQTTSDFLDLLSEGLEIPVSNVQASSSEGCIGDSLVDAFSEMAPEQLKQVETALHSEKAKQILGDDVTSVLDTLKLKEEDDWVHFDHCYTNIYGNKKSTPSPKKTPNVVVQDSEEATYVTINVGESGTVHEENSAATPENDGKSMVKETADSFTQKNPVLDSQTEATKLKKKGMPTSVSKSESSDKKITLKRNMLDNIKNVTSFVKEKRSIQLSKFKRRSSSKSESCEQPPERIVTEDEVDGIKVFKPTRNDKKLVRPFMFPKDDTKSILSQRSPLIQTKLNFNKKEGSESIGSVNVPGIIKEKSEINTTRGDASVPKSHISSIGENDECNKNLKKETPRKQPPPVTPENFGPALFSTPDIIRKINSDEVSKDGEKLLASFEQPSDKFDEVADIEKRMSAIENGEAILDRIHLQFEMQNKQRYSSQSDDDRLLSDLENTDDESNNMEKEIPSSVDTSETRLEEPSLDLSPKKSSNIDKSENSDKEDVDYEDDPNKLWCICNKPHGNRFMICCDACDNWYHGSCVGVTRPMGEKMELNGTEWLCPSCRKEKCAKEREMKLATRSVASRGKQSMFNLPSTSVNDAISPVPVSSGERVSNQVTAIRRKSSSQPIKISQSQLCIECKEKEIMQDAIYCSNACITRHVDTFVRINSSPSDPLPDEQKIIVADKKRDHRITGMRAPSVANLKEWLMEHPSYEIVRPSAFPMSRPASTLKPNKPIEKLANAVKSAPNSRDNPTIAAKAKLSVKSKVHTAPADINSQTSIRQFFTSKPLSDVDSSKIKKIQDSSGNILIREGNVLRTVSSASKKDLDLKLKEKQRQIKLIPIQPILKPEEESKPVQQIVRKIVIPVSAADKEKKRKTEATVKEKPTVVKKVEIKRQDSKKSVDEGNENNEPPPVTPKGPEPIRAKLKKSLSELFVSRSKDISDITVPEAELITLATQVEEELFRYFRDTGQKYKNKYRSLVFNLRDQKNNLFKRVADKSLTPFELVRLTPEELASTELAQWREREAKHEIDMIKKTELENLNQSKVLVVKTHKGELEIESETLPPSITDTVVPDLQPDEFPAEKDKSRTFSSSTLTKDKEKHNSSTKDRESSKNDSDKKDRRKKSDHRDKDRHKSRKHKHRSSELDHHRSRSRRRSKSVDKDGHKSTSEKSGHRSRSSDKNHCNRNSDKDRHQSRNKRKRSRSRSRRKHKSLDRKSDTQFSEIVEAKTEPTEKLSVAFETENPTEDEEKIAADLLSSYNAVDVDLSDMEPTSTVTIKTPPYAHSPESHSYVWKGMVAMPEVAKFHTVLREVSGHCDGLDEDLPSVIECVGRIKPEVMWRYISEVKKSGHELLVLRFEAQDETQNVNYLSLYSYLSTKNRMGVIGCSCPSIKDFYVMTLASHSPVPQVLLPLDGPGFDDNRSHMLLGIIVRTRRKKYSSNVVLPQPSSLTNKKIDPEVFASVPYVVTPGVESDSFTPPHSPTSVFVNNSVTAPSITNNDEDEPYSPEDDDEEPYSPSALDDEHSSKSLDFLQREMEEINRKIAEEKQKIESISSTLPLENQNESSETYSPKDDFPSKTETPSVQLPDDLQQLLNSFSKRSNDAQAGILQADPIVSAYKSNADNDYNVEDVPANPSFSSPECIDDVSTETENVIDETKLNRDPRRKQITENFSAQISQPPPPGMEDEFSIPSGVGTTSAPAEPSVIPMSVPDQTYAIPLPASQFGFTAATAPTIPPFPPPMIPTHPQMYMTPQSVFQAAALPFAPIPAAQMYVPPTVLHHDPSMIPLPIDGNDKSNILKRKAVDDMDDDDKEKNSSRKSDLKNKKNMAYYSADSKSSRSHSRSPSRHKGSSSYDSHRRGYSRDEEYAGSSHSRYPHKHGKIYSNRRSSYWKGGNDYSSSHRKYSDRNRRSNSREKSSRRYDTSKNS